MHVIPLLIQFRTNLLLILGPILAQGGPKTGPKSLQKLVQKIIPKMTPRTLPNLKKYAQEHLWKPMQKTTTKKAQKTTTKKAQKKILNVMDFYQLVSNMKLII